MTTDHRSPVDDANVEGLRRWAEAFSRFASRPSVPPTRIVQVTDRVFTWQWYHYTTLIVKTSSGLVIADPANRQSASMLKAELSRVFPDAPVRALLYSHEHLDHASGGAVLSPARVIAHRRVGPSLADFPGQDVLPPTEHLDDGDAHVRIDDMDLEIIHTPGAHTDALVAIRIPDEQALYVADLAAVQAIPFCLQNLYLPGAIRQIEALCQRDFTHFVAAHFDAGTKEDLMKSGAFFSDVRRAGQAVLRTGRLAFTADALAGAWEAIYAELAPTYGAWHGFNEQSGIWVMRSLFGEFIGY